jgi:hypothetical protein
MPHYAMVLVFAELDEQKAVDTVCERLETEPGFTRVLEPPWEVVPMDPDDYEIGAVIRERPMNAAEWERQVTWRAWELVKRQLKLADRLVGVPEIDRGFDALEVLAQLPAGTVLDGELMAGSASSDVGRIDLTDTRVFVVFDVLSIGTHDAMHMPWSHRRPLVERVVRDVNSPKVIATSVCEKPELFRDVFATILELGGEGVVAKRKAAPYRPGSRRRDGFLKVKPQQTTDAIVRGWEWGEGASNGHRCGALKVELVETGVMTTVGYDESPAEANRLAFENRRIELNHYGWLDSGKVRHPGFGRLRPDLEAA